MSIAGRYGLSYHCGGGLSLFATFGLVTQALALVSPDLRDEVALAPFMLARISHEEAVASLDSALRLQPFTHRVVGHALIFPPLPGICQGPTRPVTNVTVTARSDLTLRIWPDEGCGFFLSQPKRREFRDGAGPG